MLLHLLSLLVVGCVVLHTLSVCGEQVYKQDSAERATVEEYLKIFQNDDDNGQPPTKRRRVRICYLFMIFILCMIITSLL